LGAPPIEAQEPRARLEGTVADSIHDRPLAGASILLTSITQPGSQLGMAMSDDRGRFRFDSLAPGRYAIDLLHPILDSLELVLPPREVTVGPAERARVALGTPSVATMHAAACPGLRLSKDTGAVVGSALDADTDRPFQEARVVVAWSDLSIDRTTLRMDARTRSGAVPVDSLGRYRLCGVPTDTYVLVQLQAQGRVSTTLRVNVPSDIGVLVRRLSLSASTAPYIAAIDSTATPSARSGVAALSGIVLGAGGRPVSDAQVRVLDAGEAIRTDSAGHFSLANLPAGTQLLEIRQVGYLLAQVPVELRANRGADATVRLTRIVSLDSIRIVARRSLYTDFETRRRSLAGLGKFLNEQEIDRRAPQDVSDLIRPLVGFLVRGAGLDATVTTRRGAISFLGGECKANIVIDGMQHQDINLLHPIDVGAIEAYSGPAGAPPMYDSSCGLIVITTRR
jgi:hypothetical protein